MTTTVVGAAVVLRPDLHAGHVLERCAAPALGAAHDILGESDLRLQGLHGLAFFKVRQRRGAQPPACIWLVGAVELVRHRVFVDSGIGTLSLSNTCFNHHFLGQVGVSDVDPEMGAEQLVGQRLKQMDVHDVSLKKKTHRTIQLAGECVRRKSDKIPVPQ